MEGATARGLLTLQCCIAHTSKAGAGAARISIDDGACPTSRIAQDCHDRFRTRGWHFNDPAQAQHFLGDRRSAAAKLPNGARSSCGRLSISNSGTSRGRWRARCCRRRPAQVLLPDVPNWAWHEYGMRVGVWRFFELFERLGIRPTLSINARVCEEYRARGRGGARGRLGVHGPCLGADADPQGRGSGGDDRNRSTARTLYRHEAERLARPGLDRDLRDARICSPTPGSDISATGSMTTSRPTSAPSTGRSSPCPIRSSSTTSR